jgi:hypothetical protein
MDVLVSVAVIAILVGMLLPKLSQVQETARRVVCQSNVRQIGIGIMSYANEHQGWLPASVFLPDGPARGSMEPQNMNTLRLAEGRWDGIGNLYLGEYVNAPKVFYCPSHRGEKPFLKYAGHFTAQPGEIIGNYHFRGEGPAGHGPHGPTTRNLDRIDPAFSSLISDSMQLQSDYNHKVGSNFFRADLSVHWYSDPGSRIRFLLPATKAEADNNLGYVPEVWSWFDDSANAEQMGTNP